MALQQQEEFAPIHAPPEEKDWNLHHSSAVSQQEKLNQIQDDFTKDGYVCLSSIFPPELIEKLRSACMANFEECFRVLYRNGHSTFPRCVRRREGEGGQYEYALKHGVRGGFREVVMRSPGRFEMPFRCDKPPFSDEAVVRNERILAVVRELLSSDPPSDGGDDFHLCNTSLLVATAGCTAQGWHVDGPHLNLMGHDPCHCLNVFVPLVDIVDPALGPTEIRPGSHFLTRRLAPMMLAARARGELRSPVVPLLRVGGVLVFDYRVLHRGLSNTTAAADGGGGGGRSRPVLVLTFAKKGFQDRLNFPKRSIEDVVASENNMENTEQDRRLSNTTISNSNGS